MSIFHAQAAFLLLGLAAIQAGESDLQVVRRRLTAESGTNLPDRRTRAAAPSLPPTPPGVSDFALSELIVHPVGPRGLEFTPRAHALDGQIVRVTGYMVRQSQPLPWAFLLSPLPLTLHEREFGLAEDLPVSVLHVFYPRQLPPVLAPERRPIVVTGTLHLGNREEADGRISAARLEVSALELGGLPTLGLVTGGAVTTNPPAPPLSAVPAVSPVHPKTP